MTEFTCVEYSTTNKRQMYLIVTCTSVVLTFLLDTIAAASSDDGKTVEHSYMQDAQESLAHVLDEIKDEIKAFQKRIEDSVLMTEKGAFYLAGILCAITAIILIGGALYCHLFGNYVTKYIRITKKNGKVVHEELSERNGRLKGD